MIKKRSLTPFWFLLPAILLMTILYAYPLFLTVKQSFENVALFGGENQFVGLANYKTIFSDDTFIKNFKTTFHYSVITITIKMLGGFFLALILKADIYGRKLWRFLMLIPWAIPQVAVSVIWSWIYDGHYGYLNYFLQMGGWLEKNISWLANPDVTLYAVSFVDAWMGFPLIAMMLLAGLEAIPKELYEASRLEGASGINQFFHITLPEISGVLLITTTLVSIWTFNSFNVIYVLTQGGPLRSTETLMMRIYNESFQSFNFGLSSALSVVVIILLIIFTFLYIRQLLKED